ncbi:hypothetical protein evm_014579 [Chilo suppressalis]|nr:hypothetical protein evm_014579 [Chilo suppressalis]
MVGIGGPLLDAFTGNEDADALCTAVVRNDRSAVRDIAVLYTDLMPNLKKEIKTQWLDHWKISLQEKGKWLGEIQKDIRASWFDKGQEQETGLYGLRILCPSQQGQIDQKKIVYRWEYYESIVRRDCVVVVKLAVFLNVVENLSLLGLTHWTSSQNYPYHEVCFKLFIGASILYMFFTCMMLSKYRRRSNFTTSEKYSTKLKWRSFLVNVGSFTFAAYFFLRHNRLCEPYVYSMFGFSEYIVVISNITYHLTTVYDLQVKFVYLSKKGIGTE